MYANVFPMNQKKTRDMIIDEGRGVMNEDENEFVFTQEDFEPIYEQYSHEDGSDADEHEDENKNDNPGDFCFNIVSSSIWVIPKTH